MSDYEVSSEKSHSARSRWKLLVGAGAAAALLGFAGVYLLFFQGSDVAPLGLGSSSPSASAGSGGDPTGTWTVASGSEAGYRVREKLAFLSAPNDAVGRTSDVTGSLTIERDANGAYVAKTLTVTVDMTTIKSDERRRDNRIRTRGLQTDTYKTSTFTMTDPVTIPAEAASGATVKLNVTGDLTIHGVTKRVTIPIEARGSGDRMEVAGSLTFPMTDFDIEKPDIANFVTVESDGTMEFKIVLTRTSR